MDPHVPKRRVDETATVMERVGARVTKRIYRRDGSHRHADEIEFVRSMLDGVLAGAGSDGPEAPATGEERL